jgi:hypothetical protein
VWRIGSRTSGGEGGGRLVTGGSTLGPGARAAAGPYWTTIVAVMLRWIEQWQVNVPGAAVGRAAARCQ